MDDSKGAGINFPYRLKGLKPWSNWILQKVAQANIDLDRSDRAYSRVYMTRKGKKFWVAILQRLFEGIIEKQPPFLTKMKHLFCLHLAEISGSITTEKLYFKKGTISLEKEA